MKKAEFISVLRLIRDTIYPEIKNGMEDNQRNRDIIRQVEAKIVTIVNAIEDKVNKVEGAYIKVTNTLPVDANGNAVQASLVYSPTTNTYTLNVPTGSTGDEGEKGDKGDKGDTGSKGDTGEKGENALQMQVKGNKKPADILALTGMANGDAYVATESGQDSQSIPVSKGDILRYNGTEWITLGAIKGEKGDTGVQGNSGKDGVKGDKGDKGEKGDLGQKGDKGDQGVQGAAGKNAIDGIDGQDGKDGAKGDKGDKGATGKPTPGVITGSLNGGVLKLTLH